MKISNQLSKVILVKKKHSKPHKKYSTLKVNLLRFKAHFNLREMQDGKLIF